MDKQNTMYKKYIVFFVFQKDMKIFLIKLPNEKGGIFMWHSCSVEEIAKNLKTNINIGLIFQWIRKYNEQGINGLKNKTKPGNPLSKYQSRKELTKEEQLEYENIKLRIENEMLKKGFLMKEDGTYVKFTK